MLGGEHLGPRGNIMRAAVLCSGILSLALAAHPAAAGPRVIHLEPASEAPAPAQPASYEHYRGYTFDLSENADRNDVAATAENLRRQLDTVESVGLSPRVLRFFHSVPIIASEMACLEESAAAACYGMSMPERESRAGRDVTSWDHDRGQWTNSDPVDLAVDSGIGIIMLRPNMMRYAEDPVMLHELLHAYHAKLMPNGFDNKGVKDFYGKAKDIFGKDAYVAKNNREFFAVTASIFLVGKDSAHEPNTRAKLKEKMPDYYKYLVGVFGFDPDAPAAKPLASAE
jgi:hypothetical protein